ncbi:MAG: acyloxyacyl hydrolase [Bacteroidota bacterium]
MSQNHAAHPANNSPSDTAAKPFYRSPYPDEQRNAVTTNIHYGFVLRQNSAVSHLARRHTAALSLDYSAPALMSPAWRHVYGYADIGITLNHFYTGNYAVMGNVTGIGFYAEPNMVNRRRHMLSFRVGTGLGYNPVVFNRQTNPTDVLMSSHISNMMQFIVKYRYRFTDNISFVAGLGLTHFSNGGIKLPNQGINLPTFSAGLRVSTGREVNKTIALPGSNATPGNPALPSFEKGGSLQITGAFALVEVYPSGGSKYPYYIANAAWCYRKSLKTTWQFGAEYFNNTSLPHFTNMPDSVKLKGPYFRIGVFAGHELHFSRISLVTQLGYYAYNKTTVDPPLYQRLGIRYYIKPRFFAAIGLKTHYGAADCLEWTIGGVLW